MANITDVYNGELLISKEVYQQDPAFFDDYIRNLDAEDGYGINIDTATDNYFTFWGAGRWSMHDTWQFAFEQANENQERYQKFLSYFVNNPLVVEYDEYGPDTNFWGRVTDHIYTFFDQVDQEYKVTVKQVNCLEYEYSAYNRISYDMEDRYLLDDDKCEFIQYYFKPWFSANKFDLSKFEQVLHQLLAFLANDPNYDNAITLEDCSNLDWIWEQATEGEQHA